METRETLEEKAAKAAYSQSMIDLRVGVPDARVREDFANNRGVYLQALEIGYHLGLKDAAEIIEKRKEQSNDQP